jgi:hypothetical protein
MTKAAESQNQRLCATRCPASYTPARNYVNPGTANLPVQGTAGLTFYAAYTTCNTNPMWYAEPASWSSQNSSIATVNSSGTVTGQSVGTTTVTGQYTGTVCIMNPMFYCEASSLPGSASATINVCSLSMASPVNGQVFALTAGNYNQATVPLKASSACPGTANWTFNYGYTSLASVTYTSTSATSSTIGQTSNYASPIGSGGQINLSAKATLAGQQLTANSLAYIDGTTIPDSSITSRLLALYTSGATPHLLTGIASAESSYRQFSLRSLYQAYGYWPLESPAPALGGYVGLMQVPNGMTNAFDWITNTSAGASIFQQKLSQANSYISDLRSQYPQLPALTGQQIENEALSRYGGFSDHYYTVNSTHNGWVTTTRTDLLQYVSSIRGNMR